MIICPVRILLNTFHIFRSAGEQFLLFPGISTLGHFVPKLRNGASASVFAALRDAKIASVATLALLAVSEIPIRSLAC